MSKMPRKKNPSTLQSYCVAALGDFIYSCNSNALSCTWLEKIPISCLPSDIKQDIINYLGKFTRGNSEKFISKNILKLLLCGVIEHLDLTPVRIQENELSEVLEFIISFAPRLQTLKIFIDIYNVDEKEMFFDLLKSTNVGPMIIKLTEKLNNITKLHLHNICTDELLDCIGQNCPEIIILRAMSENITDIGLISLCININDPSDTKLRCQKLQKISLDPRAINITTSGIQVILENLPALKYVEGCVIGNVLEEIFRQENYNPEKQFQLSHYMYDWTKSGGEFTILTKVMNACPFITDIILMEPDDESLIRFGTLQHLSSCTIISYSDRTTFEVGVAGLLQQNGRNITKLSLSLSKIDLSVIDVFCPNLNILDCSSVKEVVTTSDYSQTPFANLHDLVFHTSSRTTLSADTLKKLLSNCLDLRYLYITCCGCLTDELWYQILAKNPLLKLSYLHLMYVEELTSTGIEALVDQENELKRLWLFNVSGSHKVALRRIKDIIKENNYDLEVNDSLLM